MYVHMDDFQLTFEWQIIVSWGIHWKHKLKKDAYGYIMINKCIDIEKGKNNQCFIFPYIHAV